jgi:hypothetical protein
MQVPQVGFALWLYHRFNLSYRDGRDVEVVMFLAKGDELRVLRQSQYHVCPVRRQRLWDRYRSGLRESFCSS